MRNRIYLGTFTDCLEFCNVASSLEGNIFLTNENGKYRVNAKSVLGCFMASSEWGDIVYVETDPNNDYYSAFEKWIIIGADDAANIHN